MYNFIVYPGLVVLCLIPSFGLSQLSFDNPPPADQTIECNNTGQSHMDILTYLNGVSAGSPGCEPVVVTNDYMNPGIFSCADTLEVEITASDNCGNSISAEIEFALIDTIPPIITFIQNDPPAVECDSASMFVQGLIDDIINAAHAVDSSGCTSDSSLIWIVSPLGDAPAMPTYPDPNCIDESFAGDYIFEVTVMDECGNISPQEIVTITLEDTTPPIIPSFLPADTTYTCADDVPPAPDLMMEDVCSPIEPPFIENLLSQSCPNQFELERIWIFEDACGNSAGLHTQIITVEDQDPPQWLGNQDDYLPHDIVVHIYDCSECYLFPDGMFEDPFTGESWPNPLIEGVHFEDTCPEAYATIFPPPNEEYCEGETMVYYTVIDECDNILTHTFTVNVVCLPCGGGGLYCPECEDTIGDGCFYCDIQAILNGFTSCTPEWIGVDPQAGQPSPLCNGQGVPSNMSWFAFTAGGPNLSVKVLPLHCDSVGGAIGLQSGVYDFCEDAGGECIGGEASCSQGMDPIEYEVTDLVAGNTYYLFIDGCDGADCVYKVEIEKGLPFVLDTPNEVVVEASCEPSPLLSSDSYCPETVLQFDILHLGDSPSDMGEYDAPGIYDPELDATFYWTFDPPIEGMSSGEWNPVTDGFNIPPLSFNEVTDSTVYEICLTEIEMICKDKFCDNCCKTIRIVPLPDEFFGTYLVTYDDLLSPGWDPELSDNDPNGDGISWRGSNMILLEEVLMSENGFLEYEVFDTLCNCSFTQSIQVFIIDEACHSAEEDALCDLDDVDGLIVDFSKEPFGNYGIYCDSTVLRNMQWYSFVAGGRDVIIDIEKTDPSDTTKCEAIRIALMDGCFEDGGECLAQSTYNEDQFEIFADSLVIGEVYTLLIGATDSTDCSIGLDIIESHPFDFPPLDEFTFTEPVYELPDTCEPQLPGNRFCVGSDVLIEIEDVYANSYFALYTWVIERSDNADPNVNWHAGPFSGTGSPVTIGDFENEESYPYLVIEFEEAGDYNVCLVEVDAECDDEIGQNCIPLTIVDTIQEFGTYNVCETELQEGWQVPDTSEAGRMWPDSLIYFDDVVNAEEGILELADTMYCDCNILYRIRIMILNEEKYFLDSDGDGFGSSRDSIYSCEAVVGYVTNPDDCDDSDSGINPDALEIPDNGIDEDCDGMDETTSVHELGGQSISIYPNPLDDFLYIDTELTGIKYQLYTLQAELVGEGQVNFKSMDLSGLPAGVYLIKLHYQGDWVTKFIMIH